MEYDVFFNDLAFLKFDLVIDIAVDEASIIEHSKDESTNDSQSDESNTSEQNPEPNK